MNEIDLGNSFTGVEKMYEPRQQEINLWLDLLCLLSQEEIFFHPCSFIYLN
jgi:hypothetical protein